MRKKLPLTENIKDSLVDEHYIFWYAFEPEETEFRNLRELAKVKVDKIWKKNYLHAMLERRKLGVKG